MFGFLTDIRPSLRSFVIVLSLAAISPVPDLFSQASSENLPKVQTGKPAPGTPLKLKPNQITETSSKTVPQTSTEKPAGKKKAAPNAQAAMRKALPKELGELFPIGRVFEGVAIPSYEDNSLESVMNSKFVKRVSKDHINFTDLIFFFYDSTGQPKTSIQMDKAQYHLPTGILTSKTPANIEQERFTMRGDKMTFETDSNLAQLDGDVRMLIYDDKIVNGGRDTEGKGAVEITAQKSTMDNVNHQITFRGNVLILNKQDNLTMKCDKLEVFLVADGAKAKDINGKQSKISHAVASGRMIEVRRLDTDGTPQIALARVAHYNAITKDAILSGGPPTIQDGKGNFVVTKSRDSKIILHDQGKYEITGSESHTITLKSDRKTSSFNFGGGIN